MGLFRREIPKEELKKVKMLLRECQELTQGMNTCVKPKVFFEKYDRLEQHLRELTDYEKYRIFKGNLPSRDLHRLQDQEQSEINAMLQRSFVHVRDGSADLEEEGRRAAFQTYFEELEPYVSRMNRFNKKVVRDLQRIVSKVE